MSRTVIYTINKEEYRKAMRILNKLEYTWRDGESCDEEWEPAGGVDRLIYLSLYDNKTITFGTIKPEEYDYIIPLEKFIELHPLSFTKIDLEDSMIVQTYDNQYYMYFKKFRKFIGEDGFLWTDSYNNDLTYKYEEDSVFSIKAVFVTKNLYSLNLFDEATKYSGLEKIWERPEKVRMTISEIEEKLGIKNLEIVKE